MKKSKKKSALKKYDDDPLAGDLSELMKSAEWRIASFELTHPKNKTITLRLSEGLLKELKRRSEELGINYQRLIRVTLENSLRKKAA